MYDFTCSQCGQVFEDLASIQEDTVMCPQCKGTANRSPFPLLPVQSGYRADAPWIGDCTTPFSRDNQNPDVRAYLANPGDRAALGRALQAMHFGCILQRCPDHRDRGQRLGLVGSPGSVADVRRNDHHPPGNG